MIAVVVAIDLEHRAEELTCFLVEVAMDERGLLPMVMHGDPPRRLRDEDIDPAVWRKPGCSPAGFFSEENTGMATGAFLASQGLRYRVTGDPTARQNAERAFAGIRFVYNLGRERTEGYFPKPYDGRISDQISRDQYLYVLGGLKEYHAIADAAERKTIESMAGNMVKYWIDIGYDVGHFTIRHFDHRTDFMGSLFLGLVHQGYTFTGDRLFLDEYHRLFTEDGLGERMPETLRAKFLRGETYDGARYFRLHENPVMMKTMAVDHLWDADPEHRDLWARSLRAFQDDDLEVLLDREDGLVYVIAGFDPKSNKGVLTEPGPIDELEDPLGIVSLSWGGLRKTPNSGKLAYAATVIADRLESTEARDLAADILSKLTPEKFQDLIVPGPEHIPPHQAWQVRAIRSESMAYWLWAYWLGRQRGLW